MHRARVAPLLLFAALLFSSSFAANAQQALDNAAVLKLHTAGLSDDLIAQTIASSPGHYDTGLDGMIALKKAGLGDKVISAMVSKNANPNGVAPAAVAGPGGSALPPGVDEVGVYYKDGSGNWVEFAPEIVNFKSGGFLKTLATDGIVKGDMNGHVPGKSSKLQLTHPVQLLIYAPEGTAPNEYQLLKLRQNSDNREFRSATGGVIHTSSGAERDRKDFTSTKIAPRLYTVTLGPEVVPGEYGVLPPGAVSSTNAASAGKIDTFHLVE